jgi:hypothetical protein
MEGDMIKRLLAAGLHPAVWMLLERDGPGEDADG